MMGALARRAIEEYRGLTRAERFYLRARASSCPLEAVCDAVPRTGRILDVGCGSGLFARMLANTSPDRVVLGIDPDPAKIRLASKGKPLPNLRFERRDPAHPLDGESFDSATVIDVLYLLPLEEQRALLARLVRHLAPGGRLVLKCMDTRMRLKMAVDHVQEFLAVKVIRMTQGDATRHASPDAIAMWLREDSGMRVDSQSIDRGFAHAHLLLVAESAT